MPTTHPKTQSATPRLDAIEAKQEAIHTLLTHLVNGRQTSEGSDPLIHVVAGDEKWNICLNKAGKWIAGIIGVLIPMVLATAFGFAYNGAQSMTEVKVELRAVNERLDRLGRYIERVDARIDGKADKP